MTRQTKLLVAAFALVGTTIPAFANVDQLPAERMDAIKAAYASVLTDPKMDVDRLSKVQMARIAQAYESHPAPMPVDALPSARWIAMQTAYETLEPGYEALALAE